MIEEGGLATSKESGDNCNRDASTHFVHFALCHGGGKVTMWLCSVVITYHSALSRGDAPEHQHCQNFSCELHHEGIGKRPSGPQVIR